MEHPSCPNIWRGSGGLKVEGFGVEAIPMFGGTKAKGCLERMGVYIDI